MVSNLVVSNSLQPNGLQPPRFLHLWDFPGESTGVGCHFLLQGRLFPTQGSNLGLLHCRQTLYPLSHQGSPRIRISLKSKVKFFRLSIIDIRGQIIFCWWWAVLHYRMFSSNPACTCRKAVAILSTVVASKCLSPDRCLEGNHCIWLTLTDMKGIQFRRDGAHNSYALRHKRVWCSLSAYISLNLKHTDF